MYKKETSQLINAKSPDATAKSGSVVVSNNRVAQNKPSVNSDSTQGGEKYSEGATVLAEHPEWAPETSEATTVDVDSGVENGYNDERGEIYGDQDTRVLERGTVSTVGGSQDNKRSYGVNTEILRGSLGDVYTSKGYAVESLAAGETAWLSERNFEPAQKVGGGLEKNFLGSIRENRLNGYDSIGRRLSPDLMEKLSDTIFREIDGTIFSFFHWSPYSFDTFKYGDGAFHFGTLQSALAIKGRSEEKGVGVLKEVYINSKNPLVIKDEGGFGPYNICEQLHESGLLSDEQLSKVEKMEGYFSDKYNTEAGYYVRNFIKSLGYDSYLYKNRYEDTGSWSVGVFDADQIITVAENGILKSNSGVSETESSGSVFFCV